MGWVERHGKKLYRYIHVGGGRNRQEHRVIMEKIIGRELIPFREVVHHKDGNTLNNDVANLEIKSAYEHTRHHLLGTKRGWIAPSREIDLMKWMKHAGFHYKEMEKLFPYGHSTIWRYVSGKGRVVAA